MVMSLYLAPSLRSGAHVECHAGNRFSLYAISQRNGTSMAEWVDLTARLNHFQALLDEYETIVNESGDEELFPRLRRWQERVTDFLRANVNEKEAKRFQSIHLDFDPLYHSLDAVLTEPRTALRVLMDEVARHPERFYDAGSVVAVRNTIRRLFVSHAAMDRVLAEALRDQLARRLTGVDLFLASRPGHIPTGQDWWAVIQGELKRADAYVILLTPTSLNRPWIPFETGAAWMTGRPLYTVSAAGLEKAKIPNPLAFFQVSSLDDEADATAFLTDVGASADDIEEFCRSVRQAGATANATRIQAEGWEGVSVGRRYFAWDGPTLFNLMDWPAVPTPEGLIDAIRACGLVPSYGTRDRLTNYLARGRRQVFETDKAGYKRPVLGGGSGEDQILLVHSNDS